MTSDIAWAPFGTYHGATTVIVLKGNELRVSGLVDSDPPDLLANPPEGGWLVAHCLPRQEKIVARETSRLGIPRSLFYERRLRHYPGKGHRETLVPLIGGYLFCQGSWQERAALFRTERLVRVVMVPETQPIAHELHLLAVLVTRTSGPLVVKPELVPGRLVTIRRGSLAGLMGVVVHRKGHTQLVVNLTVLGTSVAVELPADTAEALDAG